MSTLSRDKLVPVAEFLAEALAATQSRDVEVVLAWLEAGSSLLAAKLDAEPSRTANVKLAISRAVRAKQHWQKSGREVPVYQHLIPAARQLRAALA